VAHVEFAEAVELQRESVRALMVEQGGFQAEDYRVHHVFSLFLGLQGQSTLNSLRQLVSTFRARTHEIWPFRSQ